MKILKKNYKLLIGFILGLVVAGTSVYAATVISSKDISYDNTSSKLSSTNVKDALDELSTKTELKNRDNIVEGYTYNQTSGASTYCVTGEEATCVKTTCYKSTNAGSCPAGTIIRYKVNDTDIVTFHVMFDNGKTMTMQSQKNTISNTPWISNADYENENTDLTPCGYKSCNDEGPMTALVTLERATSGWTNVNNQTYVMGTTVFKTNAYTGCSAYNACTTNTYTLPSRTAKARMIVVQEAAVLGCTQTEKSCPVWMYNYLNGSTNYGGTIDDNYFDISAGVYNGCYWTMSSSIGGQENENIIRVGYIHNNGYTRTDTASYNHWCGIRAVVVVNK